MQHFRALDDFFYPLIFGTNVRTSRASPLVCDYLLLLGMLISIQTDYFHTPYREFIEAYYDIANFDKPPNFTPSGNNLINGKMDYDCSLVKDGTTCSAHAGVSKL